MLSDIDRAKVKKQIEYYKKHRKLLQFGTYSRMGDIVTDDIIKWQITSKDKSESMLGYFVDRVRPNNGNDVIKFRDLDEEKDYDISVRTQILEFKNFGEMINVPLPKKMDLEDGKLFEFLCKTIKLRNEKEDYTIGGDALMNSGFKPKQPFNYSGYNFTNSRMLFDNDSRMYYICEKK